MIDREDDDELRSVESEEPIYSKRAATFHSRKGIRGALALLMPRKSNYLSDVLETVAWGDRRTILGNCLYDRSWRCP